MEILKPIRMIPKVYISSMVARLLRLGNTIIVSSPRC